MDYNKIYDMIFEEFVFLESATNVLSEYINSLSITPKEKIKRLVLIRQLARNNLKTSVIDDTTISALIKEANTHNKAPKKSDNKNIIKSFNDIQIDDSNTFDQDIIKCNYIYSNSIIYVDSIKDMGTERSIFSNAVDKPRMFLTHFNLVKHFLFQNPNFKTKFNKKADGLEISSLGSLQGTNSETCVLGMLMLSEEGRLQLQDLNTTVNVDITEIQEWGRGYFTPGCVVLAQGSYKNDVLKAKLIMHPPPVWNELTFSEQYETDYFGAISKAFKNGVQDREVVYNSTQIQQKFSSKPEENFLLNFLNRDLNTTKVLYPRNIDVNINLHLETLTKSNFNPTLTERLFENSRSNLENEFFIVISNPDLTNKNVLEAIDRIITGYSPHINSNIQIPFMIIFTGNFTPETSFQSFKEYTTCFENLANILLKNSSIIKGSYIVFVPGSEEFSLFSGFPKHPIVDTIITPLKKKIPNIISATNPCRFSVFGKEIVIFRDNLNKKLSRNSIVKCEDINKNKEFYVHTVLSQGSLTPLDLNVTPRVWHLGHSLLILPLPDILILADVVEDFYIPINKTHVANPGNFSKDFSFILVFPLKKLVEPCKINLV